MNLRRLRNRWPLTLRGSGALVLAIACFVLAHELGSLELVYFGCLLVALLLTCLLLLRVGGRVRPSDRQISTDTIAVGASATVSSELSLAGIVRSGGVRWHETLSDGLAGEVAGILTEARAVAAPTLRYEVQGTRRGPQWIGPLSVTTTDPFGIARRTQTVGVRTRVLVVPSTVDLDPIDDYTGDLGGAQHTSTEIGQGADNLIARPYMPGDSMRRIHWRATAHHDQLMVREEERESTPEATVVFDRSGARWDASAHAHLGADPRFEAALTAVISVVQRLAHDGYLVDVLSANGTAIVPPLSGSGTPDEIAALLRTAAMLMSTREEQLAGLAGLFTGGTAGPVVVVTGSLTTAQSDMLRPIAHHSALPILLACPGADGGATRNALTELNLAGWHTAEITAEITADGDLAAAWHLASTKGVARVPV